MTALVFKPIEEGDLSTLSSWFEDEALRHWVQPPTRQWFDYVHNHVNNQAWMVLENDIPVGLVQLDIHSDQNAYFLFITNPALRNRGYGKRILRSLLQMVDHNRVKRIIGTVEPENIASIRCMQSAGFIQDDPEPDVEGFLHFSYLLINDP